MLEAATPCHARVLAALHAQAFPAGEQWDADAMAAQLCLPGVFGWVAPQGGMVLARVAADEAEILTLAVDPGMQRRGLGRALLAATLDTAAARGAVTLFLEVAATNGPARALYADSGFGQVGRRPNYYPGGADALVLRRVITLS